MGMLIQFDPDWGQADSSELRALLWVKQGISRADR